MLYKLTILLIQHVLEGNSKEALIDQVDMCTALLQIQPLVTSKFRFYLDIVRIQLRDDDNHHDHDHGPDHDRNHGHNKKQNNRNDKLDLGRSRKRRRVISGEGSANGQINDDWAEVLQFEIKRQQHKQFRIQRGRQKQAYRPIQDPVYTATLRIAKEEAFLIRNNIFFNLDQESNVSWTCCQSINQEFDNNPIIKVSNSPTITRSKRQLRIIELTDEHSDLIIGKLAS
ncbi:MAG: hypothetical protein EZS28_006284 [Streblomastix strix]|uniref:Uncharacterized protein n=1 Tax=Streblomastix strix TaxID=222440 RepID=A0A5J4WTG0_9EUKA|nr:MAG: hypothetical protein EZS28_006284 [Streblomastix strix]